MRYYLDAAPIIYLVEQRQPFATAVRSKLAALGIVPITSPSDKISPTPSPLTARVEIPILLSFYPLSFIL